MGLAEEIARVRMQARGSEINARHRRSRETAARVAGAMGPPSAANGVDPRFAATLDAARERARLELARQDTQPRTPEARIDELVRQGKLPPRPGGLGVGYEPTPEEVLGDLLEAEAPEGTEELPDAAAVLAGEPPEAAGDWGQAPGAEAPKAVLGAPGAAGGQPPLARPAPVGHSKRKRGK